MRSHLGSYAELVGSFLGKGYRPTFFEESTGADGELIIRHDVDFDCRLAHDMSLTEDELGVKSTYFFLVRSDSYNLFSPLNSDIVRSIHARGHRVSVHFDPSPYQNVEAGFGREKTMFESFFGVKLGVFSVHRPNDFLKDCDAPVAGVEHTYQDKYFKDIKYVSDSQGAFRYGHPHETDAWKEGKAIHLLIHPLWWTIDGVSDNLDLLDRFVEGRDGSFRAHVAENCIPYRERLP